MDIMEMLFMLALFDSIADSDKSGLKEAVDKANEETNTDIRCELAKLKKEKSKMEKQIEKLIEDIKLIDIMISRLESIDKKIND